LIKIKIQNIAQLSAENQHIEKKLKETESEKSAFLLFLPDSLLSSKKQLKKKIR